MDRLPPIKIAQGEPFAYDVTVVGQDWTGWTGTATFKTKPQAQWRTVLADYVQEPILQVEALGDAGGLLQVGLSAAQTDLLPALPRLGYFRTCVMEISMTDGTDVKKYQANVSVATAI
jgi:hypothetical protein